jgi:hypothetical protein
MGPAGSAPATRSLERVASMSRAAEAQVKSALLDPVASE